MATATATAKRFYAEYLTYEGDQDISPVWAADYEQAIAIAKAECVGRPMKFVRVCDRWDAFSENGFITPRHVMEAPDGVVTVGDRIYWRGPCGDAPPVVVIVLKISLGPIDVERASWRDIRERGVLDIDNGHWSYGWQLEPVPALSLVAAE